MQAIISAVLLTLGLSAADASPEAEESLRGIVVDGLEEDGALNSDLQSKLPKFTSMTAISYKVLLIEADGSMKPVDGATHPFKVGDRFRIEIETHNDQFVYVFHEDDKGNRTLLLPEPNKPTPKTKKGSKTVLPAARRFFTFTPPPGKEILHVLVSNEIVKEFSPSEPIKTEAQRIEFKTIQDKIFKKFDESDSEVVTSTDVAKVASAAAKASEQVPEIRLRGVRWEPKRADKSGWKTVAKGGLDAGVHLPLRVTIELASNLN